MPTEALAGQDRPPVGLERLAAAVDQLLAADPDQLSDAALAAEVLALDRLEGQLAAAKLRRLAVADARGAAGAERGVQAGPTTGWLRATTRMSPHDAGRLVRTARMLHRGPLRHTAEALAHGEVSYAHAAALADATHDLPPTKVQEAEPVLVEAAQRLDPSTLKRLGAHLRELVDPDRADARGRARLDKRGLWLSWTYDGTLDVRGLLDPEAGEAVLAAVQPLARPTGPDDQRTAAQRRADALGELAHQALQGGRLPREGGLRPQVTVTVDHASLLATHDGGVGGVGGWGGVLPPEAARRLSCDGTITRAVVRRHPHQATTSGDATHAGNGDAGHDGAVDGGHAADGVAGAAGHASPASSPEGGTGDDGGLADRLRHAVTLLPPPLGAPVELLELGRATRVVSPGLRRALAARDGGCVAPGCDRPPQWTDAHHLEHWAAGGPTDLGNLVLLCRTHHLAVHEGGWLLGRDPATGQVTLTPPARRGHSPPAA